MRDAIREALKKALPELTGVYDPYVPKADTAKPYAVVVVGADTQRGDPTSVSRVVDIWLNYPIGNLDELDAATEKTVKAIHYQTLENPKTGAKFTASFGGVLGEDGRDEEWKIEYRGIRFNFVSLYESIEADPWEVAISKFITEETGIKSYAGKWATDFSVPSILVRRTAMESEWEAFGMMRQTKTFKLHFAFLDGEKAAMEKVGFALEWAFKIPLMPDEKKYMTMEEISESTGDDALGVGQVTIKLSRAEQEKPEMVDVKKVAVTKERIYE